MRRNLRRLWSGEAGITWRAAMLLGLLSSTVSTLFSQLTAARIGRDAAVDWMVVAAIPLRDGALQVDPSGPVILAGILFHQWADFSWAVVFFGLLGRWTGRLGPWTLALVAPAWALLTSATEWLVLVPLLPFRQPIFPLEQPYWIGFLVHATSASLYPLFPYLRDAVAGRRPSPHRRFAAGWSGATLLIGAFLGVLALLGAQGREIAWMGRDPAFDQAYMRRMMAHHRQGIDLARLGAERAQDAHLRALARLIAAAQSGENAVFDQWWRSWFGAASQICAPAEEASMPGMLEPGRIDALRGMPGKAFDAQFVALMTVHHVGAIRMADAAMAEASDLRLRIMAQAIRHGQRGEIALMRGVEGPEAVRVALGDLVLPAGDAAPDRAAADRPAP
ncbi:DUF305 domain-containing protein [Methylobacterium radiotolerans]|nr:DUF305 domain-containing protein [Methylobacterium radiotolerans]MCX4194577.1 DUF305 domain-containing protein [Methylobacterium organophilum]GEM98051.1 hypothetical protein MRA01_25910 [Methylobacterium radiotolerans]